MSAPQLWGSRDWEKMITRSEVIPPRLPHPIGNLVTAIEADFLKSNHAEFWTTA